MYHFSWKNKESTFSFFLIWSLTILAIAFFVLSLLTWIKVKNVSETGCFSIFSLFVMVIMLIITKNDKKEIIDAINEIIEKNESHKDELMYIVEPKKAEEKVKNQEEYKDLPFE